MRITCTIPAIETIRLHAEISRELSVKGLSQLFQLLFAVGFPLAFFAALYCYSQSVGDALVMTIVIIGIMALLIFVNMKVTERLLARFLAALPDGEIWSYEIGADYFTAENRGMRLSFPYTPLPHIFEVKENVQIDFPDLGKARIPFRAFASPEERSRFIALFLDKMKDRQSLEPTLAAVTSPAAEDS